MAIDVDIPPEERPPKVRIWQTQIDNGIDHPAPIAESTPDRWEYINHPVLDENGDPVLDESGNPVFTQERVFIPGVITGYHVEFDTPPAVTLALRGVWPLLHPTTGEQMLNPAGQPAYINSPYVATIRLQLSELMSYLSLWEDMSVISYSKVEEKKNNNEIVWSKLS